MNAHRRPSPLFEMALDTIGQQLRAQAPATPAETQPEPGHHEQLEDYAQILQGRLQLQHTSLALAELLHRSWQAQAAQAQRKGLRCTCHGLSQLPARVHADPQRLQQISKIGNGNTRNFAQFFHIFTIFSRIFHSHRFVGTPGWKHFNFETFIFQ